MVGLNWRKRARAREREICPAKRRKVSAKVFCVSVRVCGCVRDERRMMIPPPPLHSIPCAILGLHDIVPTWCYLSLVKNTPHYSLSSRMRLQMQPQSYLLSESRCSHIAPVSPSGLSCVTLGVRFDERLDCEKSLISTVFSPAGPAVSPSAMGDIGLNS